MSMQLPSPPRADDAGNVIHLLSSLVGQVVMVDEVENFRGLPLLVIGGRRYAPEDEWGEACATYLATYLERAPGGVAVEVVEVEQQIGLKEPSAAG